MTADTADTFTRDRASYGDRYDDHILEQYKVFVETEERLVSRRQEENRFFLSVNSLLLAVLGFLIREGIDKDEAAIAVAILGVAGIALCYSWFRIIASYKTLNEAKFVIIDEFEKQLPVRMFGAEWRAAEARQYEPFTKIERQVPFVFAALNLAATLIGLGGIVGVLHFH
jgi:hypothetical protein